MRRPASWLLGLLLLGGCSTVKWVHSDRATGETWWIRHNLLGSDEITYCRPQPAGPVACQAAQLLE